jgi:S-(hydroxymethyl)glutathione dehydrogenase/alcohol dehydrogenase
MPPVGTTITLPATSAVFSSKRLIGSTVGGSQVLRDFPRFIELAESGRLDLGAMVTRRIALADVNDGIAALRHTDGVRTVIV